MTPASGTAPGSLSVTTDLTGLAPGTYNGTVTVTAAGAGGSPKTVAVTLTVSAPPPPGGAPVGAWGFDEANGTTAGDASGRGNNGTIAGATRTTAGKIGSALSFDGINDLVTVPDSASLDLTNRATLEAWVYPTALGVDWRTVLLKEQPGQLVYALYANNDLGRPSGHMFTTGDLYANGSTAAAPEHLVAPGYDVGRDDPARCISTATRWAPALWAARWSTAPAPCASAVTTCGRNGSPAASTRSGSTTGRSRRPRSRPT